MRKITILAVLVIVNLFEVMGQEKTYYGGYKYNNNENLVFVPGSTMFTVLATGSFGDYSAWGGAFELRRQHKIWSLAGQVGTQNSSTLGWANTAILMAGVNTPSNKPLLAGIDLGFGVSQGYMVDLYSNGGGLNLRQASSIIKPALKAQVRLDISLSKSFALTVRGGVKKILMTNDAKGENPGGAWTLESQENNSLQPFAELGVSYKMETNSQLSGDNGWRVTASGGYSNLGAFGGLGADNFKRFSAHWGRDLGFGYQITKGERDPLSEVHLLGGFTWLPKGADSRVLFPILISAGLGEFEQETSSYTALDEGKTLTEKSIHSSFGIDAKILFGPSFRFNRWTVDLLGFVGGYKCIGKDYKESTTQTFGYQGTEGKTSGAIFGGELKLTVKL